MLDLPFEVDSDRSPLGLGLLKLLFLFFQSCLTLLVSRDNSSSSSESSGSESSASSVSAWNALVLSDLRLSDLDFNAIDLFLF